MLSRLLPVLVPETTRPLLWCANCFAQPNPTCKCDKVGASWPLAWDSMSLVYIVWLDIATTKGTVHAQSDLLLRVINNTCM